VRQAIVLLSCLVLVGGALGAGHRRVSAGSGHVLVPAGWRSVEAARTGAIEPRTLLVVGTAGMHPSTSSAWIEAYRIPTRGAVVVAAGRKNIALAGGGRRISFECFDGRGAAARPYWAPGADRSG